MKDNFDFDIMIDRIKKNENFSWSRFGDGEWSAILQNRREGAFNCDGHHFFSDLGEALKAVLERQPGYYIGIQNMAREQNKDNTEFQRLYSMNDWSDNEILHRASIRGWLPQFFDTIREAHTYRKIILVGNKSLISVPFEVNSFVEIPEKDCWLAYEQVRDILLKEIEEDSIILYCASMMSNILIDWMNYAYKNDITQIDCGSVFDPYVGKQTRSYHKTLKIEK